MIIFIKSAESIQRRFVLSFIFVAMAASYPKLRTNPKVKEKEKEMSQKGLNSFQIKVIALILMVFDHIHYIFSGIWDIPM